VRQNQFSGIGGTTMRLTSQNADLLGGTSPGLHHDADGQP
jgi:hypothetical protein